MKGGIEFNENDGVFTFTRKTKSFDKFVSDFMLAASNEFKIRSAVNSMTTYSEDCTEYAINCATNASLLDYIAKGLK